MQEITWKNYPWHTVVGDHYNEALGERSYGIIAFTKDMKKVLIVGSKCGDTVKFGFPQGHANGLETPWQAACRETLEESGVTIPENIPIIAEIKQVLEHNYSEEQVNKHIREQMARGEHPHWPRPGPVRKTITFFVVMTDELPTRCPENEPPICSVARMDINEAIRAMVAHNSNRLPSLEKALAEIKKYLIKH